MRRTNHVTASMESFCVWVGLLLSCGHLLAQGGPSDKIGAEPSTGYFDVLQGGDIALVETLSNLKRRVGSANVCTGLSGLSPGRYSVGWSVGRSGKVSRVVLLPQGEQEAPLSDDKHVVFANCLRESLNARMMFGERRAEARVEGKLVVEAPSEEPRRRRSNESDTLRPPKVIRIIDQRTAGGLDHGAVTKVLKRQGQKLASCLKSASRPSPVLDVRLRVNALGRLDNAAIIGAIDSNRKRCVVGVLKRLRYPKAVGETATVTFFLAHSPR